MQEVQRNEQNGLQTAPLRSGRKFAFDCVYDSTFDNQYVFNECVQPIICGVTKGQNALVMAYGQTGCGKTYTVLGSKDDVGCAQRAVKSVFEQIRQEEKNVRFLVRASHLQIYNERITDLQTRKGDLKIKQTAEMGINIENLSEVACTSEVDFARILEDGERNRQIQQTMMSSCPSREHIIIQVIVERSEVKDGVEQLTMGKLMIADLAGSERQAKVGAVGDRLKEMSSLGISLCSLGQVISALGDESEFVPYRDSKLTRILQDNLSGNSNILLIANVNPSLNSYEETISTLRFAERMRRVKVAPKANDSPKNPQINNESMRQSILYGQKQEKESSTMKTSQIQECKFDEVVDVANVVKHDQDTIGQGREGFHFYEHANALNLLEQQVVDLQVNYEKQIENASKQANGGKNTNE